MAVEGNQFWKLRTKHGRDALFTDPAKLWDAAVEYFEATDKRTWNEQNWVGKDGDEVIKYHPTPYTLTGFCVFLGVNTQYFNNFKESETFKNNPDFSVVYTRIRNIIETQQVEGAMTGFFNASLTARLNGLTDKQDVKLEGGINITWEEEKTYEVKQKADDSPR